MLNKIIPGIFPIIFCYSGLSCAFNLILDADDNLINKNTLSTKSSEQNSFFKSLPALDIAHKDKNFFKAEYQEKEVDWKLSSNERKTNFSAWSANLDIPLMDDFFNLQGKVKSGRFETYSDDYLNNRPQQTSQEILYPQGHDFKGLMNLSINGKINEHTYGFEYQSVGDSYTNIKKEKNKVKKDREGFRYWVGSKINDFNFKIGYSNLWDNVNFNPDKIRYKDQVVDISSTYKISSWPYSAITLGYKFGDRESSHVPLHKKPYNGTINGFSTSFDMSYNSLNISLGSSLDLHQNDIITQKKTQTFSYFLSTSYSPVSTLYITPNISYSTNILKDAYSNFQYNSLDVSVPLSYIPKNSPFSLSYFISRNSYKSNDTYTDNSALYNTLSLEWVISKLNNIKQSVLKMDVEQSNYIDNIYTKSSNSDLFVSVGWLYSHM
jgi:hypothetical protein